MRQASHSVNTHSTLNSLGLLYFNQHTHSLIPMPHISITAFMLLHLFLAFVLTHSFVFAHFEESWPFFLFLVFSHWRSLLLYISGWCTSIISFQNLLGLINCAAVRGHQPWWVQVNIFHSYGCFVGPNNQAGLESHIVHYGDKFLNTQ